MISARRRARSHALFWQGGYAVLGNRYGIGRHALLTLVHTSIEHRRVSCRVVLILSCQESYAQQASNHTDWCNRLLKMTGEAHAVLEAICFLPRLRMDGSDGPINGNARRDPH